MESIRIENFGPIRKLEIENLKRVTIFIGESGSGKSTIMKVIALFRWLYKMMNIRSFLKYSGVKKCPFRFKFESLLKTSNLIDYLRPDSILVYENGSLKLEWNSKTKKLLGTSNYIPKEELSLEKISFISDKRSMISDILDNNVSLKHNMYYLSETFNDFEMAINTVRELSVADLGVKFVVRKTTQGLRYYIIPQDDTNAFAVKFNSSSSGTQNVVPMNVIVEYYSKYYDLVSSINKAIFSYVSKSDDLSSFKAVKNIGEFPYKNVHLIIEEPELSLFPSSQCDLMDFMIRNIYMDQERDYRISLMMATHSPYIVNYLNVMLRRPLSAESRLSPDDLSVYLVSDGRLTDLMMVDESHTNWAVDTSVLNAAMERMANEFESLV